MVFTHWPIDSHADHRAMSMLVYDAWLKMKKGFALYYYEVSNGEGTLQFACRTHFVDITEAEPRKRPVTRTPARRFEKFYALQDEVARFRGIERGVGRAEAYPARAESRRRAPDRVVGRRGRLTAGGRPRFVENRVLDRASLGPYAAGVGHVHRAVPGLEQRRVME